MAENRPHSARPRRATTRARSSPRRSGPSSCSPTRRKKAESGPLDSSNESIALGLRARQHVLESRAAEPVHPREKIGEHRAVVVQYLVIAVLEEVCLAHHHLAPRDTAARNAAAEHPQRIAMPVVGAAVAVLAEGAAEFRHDDDDGVAPEAAHFLREGGEALGETREVRGERALRRTLVDVRVPTAHVHETD